MAPAERVAVGLRRFLAELAAERGSLEHIVQEIAEWHARVGGGTLDRPQLTLFAVDLHGYYTCAESIFERLARTFDGGLPQGHDWHKILLSQMTLEVPSVRPAILSTSVATELRELLKFRHFMRRAYVLELDSSKICDHVLRTLRLHPQFANDLDRLETFVREMICATDP